MQAAQQTLKFLDLGLAHANSPTLGDHVAVPLSVVQSCTDFYTGVLKEQMSRCAQHAATLYLLAKHCGVKGQDKAEGSCRHQASEWRQQRHETAKLLSRQSSGSCRGLILVHAWGVEDKWEFRDVLTSMLPHQICSANMQVLEGQDVISLAGSHFGSQQSRGTTGRVFYQVAQILSKASDCVLTDQCRSALCILPFSGFSFLSDATPFLMLPTLCAHPILRPVVVVASFYQGDPNSDKVLSIKFCAQVWCESASEETTVNLGPGLDTSVDDLYDALGDLTRC